MDRDRLAALGAVVLLAGGAWWYLRARQVPGAAVPAQPFDLAGLDLSGLAAELAPLMGELERAAQPFAYIVEDAVAAVTTPIAGYTPPARAEPYLAAIYAAEDAAGAPRNLFARQIHKESNFNPHAVNPYSGAKGLGQFMDPTWAEWGRGADVFEPFANIDATGRYMAWLYRRTGSWPMALAAYNWGIGNLERKGFGAAPAETRDYVASIAGDLGLA